jgi:flagellar L-ring protein FlgH
MRALGLVLVVVTSGCLGPMPLPPPRPPAFAPRTPAPGLGSLWNPQRAGNYAALDVRPRFPGDLLTVVVTERASGKKDATTEASSETSISASVQEFFGVPAAALSFLPTGFNPESVVKASSARTASGDGTTERTDTLTANITVTVTAIEPNGNLLVQGDKIIRVNREDQYIVLSGTVRPEDVRSDNTVPSTRLADARISYFGDGTVGDKQRERLVHRLFDYLWPF